MKYGTWTLGQDVGNKRATIITDPSALAVFQTVKLGTGIKNGHAFYAELESKKIQIGHETSSMLGQKVFTVAKQKEEVDLVRLSVADLGFKVGSYYNVICTRAIEMGLELCPAEVGPQLRLQYSDQPRDEWFKIAMEAIRDSRGYPRLFFVGHGSEGRWLCSCYCSSNSGLDAGEQLVFRLPRKSANTVG